MNGAFLFSVLHFRLPAAILNFAHVQTFDRCVYLTRCFLSLYVDVDKVKKKCSTRALDGSHFHIEQVNVCGCIEVSCLDPRTTYDTILYYFENAKKGGGDVSKIEYVEGSGKAFVFFDDPSGLYAMTLSGV